MYLNYHNITKDDMNNGEGLRVVLWVAGCSHYCKGCHNPITWDPDGGIEFNHNTLIELIDLLDKDYISGLTISGGDPLMPVNITTINKIVKYVRHRFPNKTIWVYTGYTWEDFADEPCVQQILKSIDVIVDGEFIESLADVHYKWAGSTNQRIIDVKKSIEEGKVVLYESH